jgi:hypothetical protein
LAPAGAPCQFKGGDFPAPPASVHTYGIGIVALATKTLLWRSKCAISAANTGVTRNGAEQTRARNVLGGWSICLFFPIQLLKNMDCRYIKSLEFNKDKHLVVTTGTRKSVKLLKEITSPS